MARVIFIVPTDQTEIAKIIQGLQESSSGWDDLNLSSLKLAWPFISSTMMHVLNLSLNQGVFPSELKIAWEVPIFPVFQLQASLSINTFFKDS